MKQPQKSVDEMSLDELKIEFAKLLKENPPRKVSVDANGTIVLDPTNPFDREWFDNDKAYGGYAEEEK
ncbi:hypothetical protein [Priestia koreensis]|uniref:Uncharacterized protein n=1 Tax=Priestia koreensis TaxID=284581 RepID=A0A0M0L8S9_9BACI|nr:hypothetical protein [Priestia koreensis]KOO47470.1 hypothetical protein AMD01_05325 [Priestia koreensis]